MSSEVSPEDISDLMSKNRSPFTDNLNPLSLLGAADKPILDIPVHLSPLKESPPTSQRQSSRRTPAYPRRRHKKTSSGMENRPF